MRVLILYLTYNVCVHLLLHSYPVHTGKPPLGVTGPRSPASFQLGHIAAAFEEEEEEEDSDSPSEEEVRAMVHVVVRCGYHVVQ